LFTNPPSGQWSHGQSIIVFSINATLNTPTMSITMPTTVSYHHSPNSITAHHLNFMPCQMPPLFHLCSSHPHSTKAAEAGPQLTPINRLLQVYVWIWTYNVEHMPNVIFSAWNCVWSWYSPTCMWSYLPVYVVTMYYHYYIWEKTSLDWSRNCKRLHKTTQDQFTLVQSSLLQSLNLWRPVLVSVHASQGPKTGPDQTFKH